MQKPIKRHESLKPLSRDHHHGLLLCWKIKMAKKKNVSPDRVSRYLQYFYNTQLTEHFRIEEDKVFPLLGSEDPLVRRALREHKDLRKSFGLKTHEIEDIEILSDLLETHIRFEERVLFNEIQKRLGEQELEKVLQLEDEINTPDPDDWEDKFWVRE